MPTYVYKFLDTGETIEVQQSFTDPTLTEAEHPVTGDTMPVKKVFLPVGVTFRGNGFYKTDSRSNGAKSGSGSAGTDSGSPASSSSSSDSGSSGSSDSGSSSSSSGSSSSSDSGSKTSTTKSESSTPA